MTKKELEELRGRVKKVKGGMKEIARVCGCTREWVRLVLRGDWNDWDVIEEAAKCVEEYERRKDEVTVRVRGVLNV